MKLINDEINSNKPAVTKQNVNEPVKSNRRPATGEPMIEAIPLTQLISPNEVDSFSNPSKSTRIIDVNDM